MSQGSGKSDRGVVPKKPANKAAGAIPAAAEPVEGRLRAKGNANAAHTRRTPSRPYDVHSALDGIRQTARGNRQARFTTLMHHVHAVERLQAAYFALQRDAAAGVDGMTWHAYGQDLEDNLQELSTRLARGGYHAKPVKRVYIDKADGSKRPLGVPALEDKIVQRATVEVLNAIYEQDFLGWVAGFQFKGDAERFQRAVAQRLEQFGLRLHPEKTRLIEFGRFARDNRGRRGQGKPETFDFLGFTHCCGTSRAGKFMVLRLSSGKRLRAKLLAVKQELRRRMHQPIAEQGAYLRAVVGGHARYFAVPCNGARVQVFRWQVGRLWYRTLLRRSHKKHLNMKRMHRLITIWLPPVQIVHPYPGQRLIVTTQGRSRMR